MTLPKNMGSDRWRLPAGRNSNCFRWRMIPADCGSLRKERNRRLCVELGLRRYLVFGAALRVVTAAGIRYRRRAYPADVRTCRALPRYRTRVDHLYVQPRFSRALYSTSFVSSLSYLSSELTR